MNKKLNQKVYLFPGCVVELFSEETIENTVRFLSTLGYHVEVSPRGLCCGQIEWNTGMFHKAEKISTPLLNWFEQLPSGATIVCLSASCLSFMRRYVFPNTEPTKTKVFELSEFLVTSSLFDNWHGSLRAKVAIHISCHHLRDLDGGASLLRVLERIDGLQVLHFKNPELCCGFGGIFSLVFTDLSKAMATRKLKGLPDNADFITSADLSCLIKLSEALDRTKHCPRILHYADLLYHASAL